MSGDLSVDRLEIRHDALASIWAYPAHKLVHHQIHQALTTSQLRALLTAVSRTMNDYQLSKWLADDRQLTAVEATLYPWIEQVLVPRAVRAGWKYWALIRPHKADAAYVMHTISAKLAVSGVTVFVFENPKAAQAWLDAQDDRSVSSAPGSRGE